MSTILDNEAIIGMDQPRHKRPKAKQQSDLHTLQLNTAIQRVSRAAKKAKTFELQNLVRKIKRIRDSKTPPQVNSIPDPSQLPLLEEHLTGYAVNKLSSNKQLAKVVTAETTRLRAVIDGPSTLSKDIIGKATDALDASESAKDFSDCADASGHCPQYVNQTVTKRQVARDLEDTTDDEQGGSEVDIEKLLKPSRSLKVDSVEPFRPPHKGKSHKQPDSDTESSVSASRDPEAGLLKKGDGLRCDEARLGRRPTTSTFLPSLNVGYACGDSDASSVEDPIYDRLEREMGRKNRRGQRARRAIWEKKFGKGAKHLQKISARRRASRAPPPTVPVSQPGASANPNLVPVGERKAVHPSWEAKVKQQEALAKAVPTGKKIVFD